MSNACFSNHRHLSEEDYWLMDSPNLIKIALSERILRVMRSKGKIMEDITLGLGDLLKRALVSHIVMNDKIHV